MVGREQSSQGEGGFLRERLVDGQPCNIVQKYFISENLHLGGCFFARL